MQDLSQIKSNLQAIQYAINLNEKGMVSYFWLTEEFLAEAKPGSELKKLAVNSLPEVNGVFKEILRAEADRLQAIIDKEEETQVETEAELSTLEVEEDEAPKKKATRREKATKAD